MTSQVNPVEISRQSIADRVRQLLMERIIDGSYPPGMRLVEMQIAREFNTSQAPVREALRTLEAARIVETVPHRGTRVRQVGERERRGAYQVRAVLEELAAQLGAARLRERIRDLRAEADATVAAARREDVAGYLLHNTHFHEMIVEAADNAVLRHAWESLSFTVGGRARAARTSADVTAIAKEHREIVQALAHGDGKTAGRLLRRHSEVLIEGIAEAEVPKTSGAARRAAQTERDHGSGRPR